MHSLTIGKCLEALKIVIGHFPEFMQKVIYHIYYYALIKMDIFVAPEKEISFLGNVVRPGDWVVDIGANIGHYTKMFSDLVGDSGRVVAIEPVARTFSFLSSNVLLFKHRNVTLMNVAASNEISLRSVEIPSYDTGRLNYCRAYLSSGGTRHQVITLPLDSLVFPESISVVKIDVEGHEARVLEGMQELIRKDHPLIIVETQSNEVIEELEFLGYRASRLEESPNVILEYS
jgi:FkbM family methyltransferase